VPVIVQKFGGTSVADAHRIHLAARRAVRAKLAGRQVVLVVSAMGHTTDHLIDLAMQVSRHPPKREMDMLLATGEQVSIALMAMAIHEAGYEAISLTGAQVGLVTDSRHTEARIRSIDTQRLHKLLDQGRIVIVAGFQGADPEANITTLGRGGSDTTAVALAAALRAEMCEIYTDVDGVYTADPRVVPQARKLDTILYDEMLELASLGAGVMHARAMELGKKHDLPLHIRSSFTDGPGTMVTSESSGMEDVAIRGVTQRPEIARITFHSLPREPQIIAAIFDEIARRQINVDDIIQNVTDDGSALTLSFTVGGRDAGTAQVVAELMGQRFGPLRIDVDEDLARVSLVGVGMRSHPGVAATMFSALASEGIRIENISTSEIVISVLVRRGDMERAVQAVHNAFGLGLAPQPLNPSRDREGAGTA